MKKALWMSALCCSLLQAQEQANTEPLSALSLEDLLNIQVTSTSRREENQNLAPGVITVISAQEIHQYGARHLRDVIDRLVGTQVLSSHLYTHSKTSIRAMNAGSTEGSVLILINGRPVRDATDGGSNYDIYLGFPLKTIERIEVVRGPGSVIYGSPAMAGIINIITKDAHTSINETEVDIGAGSFNRKQLQLSSFMGGSDYSFNIGLNSIRSNGDHFDGIKDQDNTIGTYKTGEKSDNLMINGKYKGFTFTGLITDDLLDSGSSAFQLPSHPLEKRRHFLDIGYLYPISSGWDASINYTLNTANFGWQINEAAGLNRYKDRSEMVETILRGNIADNLNLLFGVNYLENSTTFDRFLPFAKRANLSGYTQIDYMLSPKQKIIAGIQMNKPENSSSDLSSRAGFIQGFGDNWWLKLLYSEAYRSASLIESYVDAPQLKGNPNLKPEQVATYDAQLIYQTAKQYFSLTLYDSMLKDLIIRTADSPPSHNNQGFVHFQGIELEGRLELDYDLSMTGNVSYQINKTNSGIKESTFAPNMMAKLGASYGGIHGMNIAVFSSYIGKSTDLTVTNNAPLKNPIPEAYNLLTANISMDMGKMWGTGKVDHSLLSLYLDNLFNEKIFAPDLQYSNTNNTVPHHWGRSANITYTYKF
ncbi:MAG: TonB-dependent receptor [Campylobacterales bacterium]|nr:TonB-dependent receptor [Campylobacterales bacterium]